MDSVIQQALRDAVKRHQAGDLAGAESAYRQILARFPRHADALQLLGVLSYQTGKHDAALELISAAIAVAPDIADWHTNLGNVLKAQGKLEDARRAFERSLGLKLQNAPANLNLGNTLIALNRPDD